LNKKLHAKEQRTRSLAKGYWCEASSFAMYKAGEKTKKSVAEHLDAVRLNGPLESQFLG
jgi:hypothetical protein